MCSIKGCRRCWRTCATPDSSSTRWWCWRRNSVAHRRSTNGPVATTTRVCVSGLLAGAGIKGGLAYGESDDKGFRPEKDGVNVKDFNATIAAALGLPLSKEISAKNGRPFKIAGEGKPILGVGVRSGAAFGYRPRPVAPEVPIPTGRPPLRAVVIRRQPAPAIPRGSSPPASPRQRDIDGPKNRRGVMRWLDGSRSRAEWCMHDGESLNIAETLRATAETRANQPGVLVSDGYEPDGTPRHRRGRSASSTISRTVLAAGLVARGLKPGQRLVLMVRPGIEFIALTYAIFRAGGWWS